MSSAAEIYGQSAAEVLGSVRNRPSARRLKLLSVIDPQLVETWRKVRRSRVRHQRIFNLGSYDPSDARWLDAAIYEEAVEERRLLAEMSGVFAARKP